MRKRSGFSLIEIFIVLIILGLLTRLAVPRLHDMKMRATAAKVIGDVHAVQVAVSTYHGDGGGWPSNGGPGSVPNELVPHLPQSFSFVKPEYSLELNVTPLAGTAATDNAIVTVDVTSTDPHLLPLISLIAQPGLGQYPVAGKYTFVLAGIGSS
jgi:prepilin-type N-terminal cleavage/methylation domain-containing protein